MSSQPSKSNAEGRKRNASGNDLESSPTGSSIGSQSDSQFTTPAKKRLNFDFWDEENHDVSPTETAPLIVSIDELASGYYPNEVSLNIRVSYKGNLRETSIGKVFDFHGFDRTSEISLVSFDEQAEKLAQLIEVDSIFSVCGFGVSKASEDHPSGTGNIFELRINALSKIEAIEPVEFPEIKFSFLQIQDVLTCATKSRVDVLGVLVKDWGLESTRKGTFKRDISLTDESKKTIKVTLWGSQAENFEEESFSVIAIRRGIVEEYKESKSISVGAGSRFWTKPSMEESVALESWFNEEMEKKKKN